MSSWHSYPKIFNIGHSAIVSLFSHELICEEKIDGSFGQIGLFNGGLKARSKGKEQYPAVDKMFEPLVKMAQELGLKDGWTYSGEVLNRCKHNSLTYNRVPEKGFILFDIRTGEEAYLSYEEKAEEAQRLGLEIVPKLAEGKFTSAEQLVDLLETESCLGGPKIEGFVLKPKDRDVFGKDGKLLIGKYVSEAFKEFHNKQWRGDNPTRSDIVEQLCQRYENNEARWVKAIYRFRDEGRLTHEYKDIGPLIKYIQQDLKEEEEEEIKQILFKFFCPKIIKSSTRNFPEFYKRWLLENNFDND